MLKNFKNHIEKDKHKHNEYEITENKMCASCALNSDDLNFGGISKSWNHVSGLICHTYTHFVI